MRPQGDEELRGPMGCPIRCFAKCDALSRSLRHIVLFVDAKRLGENGFAALTDRIAEF